MESGAGAPERNLARYGPLATRANVARAALAATAFACVVAVVFDVAERSLLARVGTGEPVTGAELSASDDRQLVISLVQLGLAIASAVAFIAWLHRAYANLTALGVAGLRFSAGWAIGAWFVPILNLFRPKQIVNDVWRGSHPLLRDRFTWRDAPVPRTFAVWWGVWLVAGAAGSSTLRLELSAESTADRETLATAYIVADGLNAVAAILAVLVVDRVTARQTGAAELAAGSPHPGRSAPQWLRGWRRAAVAAALCVAAGAVGVLTVAVQPEGAGASSADAGEPVAQPDAVASPSFSFRDDFSDPATGWVVRDDEEISYAYTDGEYRMAVVSSDATWFSLLDLGSVIDPMLIEADVRADGPDGFLAAGVGCFVTNLSGYLATITTDGYWAIGVDPPETEQLALLADGEAANALGTAPGTSRVSLLCESGPPATLTLRIDGRTVAETQHDEGLGAFRVAGLIVGAEGNRGVYFDNVEVSSAASGR